MQRSTVTDGVVAAAQAGDHAALDTVYRAYAPQILAYLRGRGAADPEGTAGDVFLAALPRIPAVTGGAQGLRMLLFSIAHARMVDEYRHRTAVGETLRYEAELDRRRAASAEEEAAPAMGAREVWQALADLPPDQRAVLGLRFLADLSVEQVAGVIGRSAGAVKQLQRRGMLAARQMITAAAPGSG